jgi:hypothetical protein
MTWKATIGYYLAFFFPAIGDKIAIRQSESGLGKTGAQAIDAKKDS